MFTAGCKVVEGEQVKEWAGVDMFAVKNRAFDWNTEKLGVEVEFLAVNIQCGYSNSNKCYDSARHKLFNFVLLCFLLPLNLIYLLYLFLREN